ncbi:MAG: glycoside-pentoside-hexuronide (GPH):cation symporter [Candidatus Izimaplasma sp.]|nr:glycoside-pentoside-hexuronide (GPH):cation symporter [Candidatus Izimaplasma bacterium]
MVITYLANFLTDEVGLAAGAVATLMLVARVWDAVNDPMLGSLVDASNPKKGKFKPWVDAVTIVMPIVTILAFWNFNGSDSFNLFYAYVSYIIWGMVYTVSDVPIFALATTMTDVPQERVSIISIGRLAAGLASIVIGIAGAQFISYLGYRTTIIILMSLSFIVMAPLRFFVKERVKAKRDYQVTLKSMFSAVFQNKYLLIFYASFIAINTTLTPMTLGPYFAKWNLGDIGLQSLIMETMAPVMIFLPLLTPWLVRTFGKRKVFIYGIGSSIIFSIIQYLSGYDSLTIFLIFNFLKFFGLLAPMVMMGIFTADIVEYGAYHSGKRQEGITFSIQTFSTKLGSGISAAISLWLIDLYGYVGDAPSQSAHTLEGIWMTSTVVPIIGLVMP